MAPGLAGAKKGNVWAAEVEIYTRILVGVPFPGNLESALIASEGFSPEKLWNSVKAVQHKCHFKAQFQKQDSLHHLGHCWSSFPLNFSC